MDCYEKAAQHILKSNVSGLRLVHGYPRLQAECEGRPVGTKYGHAWIEYGGVCLDLNHGLFQREVYYAAGQIDEAELTKYTKQQAINLMINLKHYGPWNTVPKDAVFRK